MKKLLIGATCLLSFSLTAQADETPKTVNLRTEALADILGVPNLNLDFDLGNSWTLGGGVAYASTSLLWASFSATIWDLNLTHYFAEKSFTNAWYLGAQADLINGTVNLFGLTDSASNFAAGFRGGYQWFCQRFNFQLGGSLLAGSSFASLALDFSLGFSPLE